MTKRIDIVFRPESVADVAPERFAGALRRWLQRYHEGAEVSVEPGERTRYRLDGEPSAYLRGVANELYLRLCEGATR